jgi:hypothetical protein
VGPASGEFIRFWRRWGLVFALMTYFAKSSVEFASPLARRPYDPRHAAVSTWLNGGVPAPQVAQWAGHSVDVLLRVYAKCIAGQEDAVRRRVQEALREGRSWRVEDSNLCSFRDGLQSTVNTVLTCGSAASHRLASVHGPHGRIGAVESGPELTVFFSHERAAGQCLGRRPARGQ